MISIEQQIADSVQACIKELYGVEATADQIQLQKTKKEFKGHLTLVVFPFLRQSKKSPEQTAQEIGEYLTTHDSSVSGFNVIKGFLNLTVSTTCWISLLNDIHQQPLFGTSPATDDSKLVMIEYSSPNTNKPLHLGHVRNNLLGYSLAEIMKANGYKVVKTNIVNDRGIHICKSMLAWQKWGNGDTPESTGKKGDHLIGDFYVLFSKNWKTQVANFNKHLKGGLKRTKIYKTYDHELVQSITSQVVCYLKDYNIEENPSIVLHVVNNIEELPHPLYQDIKRELNTYLHEWVTKTSLLYRAQKMLLKWEAGDTEIYTLWERMNSWVYAGFDETYKRMGVDFDKIYYESQTYLEGKNEVLRGVAEGVFYQREDSSVWADLTADGLDEKLLLRADGTSVYMTQDIGTAKLRYDDYPVDKMIYVVGNEQNYHFQVLSILLDKLGFAFGKGLTHFSYGMVELPEGKMKSREGTVVDADDLMEEMTRTAHEISLELGKLDEMTPEEANDISRVVGLGALKYFILKVDPRKNMTFNPKESIDFNGNTGPFIQYTYARIRSVLRKAEAQGIALSTQLPLNFLISEKEENLVQLLANFTSVVRDAGTECSPALVANYIYDLVKEYNQFYHDFSILREENAVLKQFRLILSANIADVVKSGMSMLGIEVPERM